MQYRQLCGEKVSLLGMGNMRLPIKENGDVDRVKAGEIVDYLYKNGVNYYDTAYVYHKGESEEFIGEALAKYPRDTWYLATKTPGHLVNPNYDPVESLDIQFKRCKVDYFDFYFLHNVMETTLETYTDKDLRVLDYLLEQKAKGKIKHLGLSTHGQLPMIEKYLKDYSKDIEFIQLQLNYLDWTLQKTKEKYELVTSLGLPVLVMEPCRGGLLANLDEESTAEMEAIYPDDSAASWAYRFAGDLENVKVVLSGITTLEHAIDNVKTFNDFKPLTARDRELLKKIAVKMLDQVPCTSCRYCCDGCPQGLNIPELIGYYNEIKFAPTTIAKKAIDALPEGKRPMDCIECGLCTKTCPQGIDIPSIMTTFTKKLADIPDWAEVSKKRIAEDRKVVD